MVESEVVVLMCLSKVKPSIVQMVFVLLGLDAILTNECSI